MYDAAIVGAGAAGLAAAESLANRGARVLLLEARDRFGGRILTISDARAGAPVELGAEFIHGNAGVTFDLLARAGGTPIAIRGGDDDDDDEFAAASALMGRVDIHGADESVEAFLTRISRDGKTSDAAAWTRALVEGFDAADPADASAIAIAKEWRGAASLRTPQFRPSCGYAPLIDALAASLAADRVDVHLQARVGEIVWEPGHVRIRAQRLGAPAEYEARTVIVTLPAGVLHAESVKFTPELPQSVREAIHGIAMGPVLKVALIFRERCWPEDGDFFFSQEGAFPTFWSTYPRHSMLITGWAGGPRAHALRDLGEKAIVAQAIADFAKILGKPHGDVAAALEYGLVHDWQRDPFAGGAYSYIRTGALSAREALAQPIAETVFFAGEATAPHAEGGTVAGALLSGQSAAKSCFDRLSSGSTGSP